MMIRRTALGALAASAASALLGACGGGTDRTKAQVRLVNASSGYDQLDLRVHGTLRQAQVSYGNSANYVEVEPDEADMQITTAGSSTALLSFTPSVSERKHYTALAYGSPGALRQVVLDENTAAPDTNKTLLRVINAAPDAGALDVYLTDEGDTALATAVAVQANAAYGTLGPWFTVDSRSWRLQVTAANNKADRRLDVSGLVLSSKQVATLVLTSAGRGVLVNGLLLTQQGAVTSAAVTYARVRAVAGVAGNASVTVRIGTQALINNVASPAIGAYTLVPVAATAVEVTVGNTVVPSPALDLTAGQDYTLLVHGTAAAPLVARLADDNRLPADGSQARIRLVNGVSGLSGPASLTVDLSPIGSGVNAGGQSDYLDITATTTAALAVSSPGTGTLYSEVDRTLLAGATYTVFVLGASTAPTGLLRKDR